MKGCINTNFQTSTSSYPLNLYIGYYPGYDLKILSLSPFNWTPVGSNTPSVSLSGTATGEGLYFVCSSSSCISVYGDTVSAASGNKFLLYCNRCGGAAARLLIYPWYDYTTNSSLCWTFAYADYGPSITISFSGSANKGSVYSIPTWHLE